MVKYIYIQILFSLSSSHEIMSVKISIAYLHNNTLKAFTRSKLLCTQVKILQTEVNYLQNINLFTYFCS